MKSDPLVRQDIVIVGGGIVGVATAALLAETGRDVLVIDRTGICEETSAGNAAAFAFSDILPLASKGVMRKVPGWLMDPLGPFTIRPSYLPKMVPWLYRFWRASNAAAQARTATAQAEIMRLAELQPGLSPRFVAGTFVPGWMNVSEPKLFGQAIWAYAESRGARFQRGEVRAARPAGGGARLTLADGGEIAAAHLIVMAGAWSRGLAGAFGDPVPLDTERGYNTTLPVGSFDVKRQLTFPGHGFVITPLETGLRVGGAVEFGGLALPPNFARADAMLKKAAMFLPGLRTEGGRQWMGYRPSMPDSLPIIGRASRGGNIYYGFGHGHLGLTQAAATGRLIRDLVNDAAPAIDIEPFKPQRFRN